MLTLPVGVYLPEGWTTYADDSEIWLTITAPEIGSVTVDFRDRGYRMGIVATGRMATKQVFTGRGWKVVLCGAAIAALQASARAPLT
jgi:hypothetical protein